MRNQGGKKKEICHCLKKDELNGQNVFLAENIEFKLVTFVKILAVEVVLIVVAVVVIGEALTAIILGSSRGSSSVISVCTAINSTVVYFTAHGQLFLRYLATYCA